MNRRHRRTGAVVAALVAIWLVILALGSSSVHANWSTPSPLAGLGSGRIWSLAVSPKAPTTLLAGTDAGVYRTTDGGSTWKLVDPAVGGARIWVVGYQPGSATAFAGTDGAGIRRSADDGVTWTSASQGLPSLDVRSMAFGLAQVAAGTTKGVALSANGTTWNAAGLDGIQISAITVVANSPAQVFLAGTDQGAVSNGYLWENQGATWTALKGNGLPSAATVSSLSSGPLTTSVSKRPLVVDTNLGTYRSLDSGTTWTVASSVPTIGSSQQAVTLTVAQFDPLDPTIVYSGADAGGSTGGAMVRSQDSGLSYQAFDSGLTAGQENVTAIAVAPTNQPTVYIAIDPESGPATISRQVDTQAEAPPTLQPEAPGAPVPTPAATPVPTATPHVSTTPAAGGVASGSGGGGLFHWPLPLLIWLVVALALIFAFIRWRQNRYVEGPP